MRRWNGWGDEQTSYHFPRSAAEYLSELIGPGQPAPDASLEQVLQGVPDSKLPDHPLVMTGAMQRLCHARGQSLPDWVALRHGLIGNFPAGVAYPDREDQIGELFTYAQNNSLALIPYGGGTSVVGHINPLNTGPASVVLDLSRMNTLLNLDETSRLATFGAGVSGPELERQLNQRGYTLGHFPQSFELSTLGGWIATRSSGQQSYHYGRIEDLFAGGHVETPLGPLDLPEQPASAAGPDLRQVLLGSEGRLGIITRAVVRVRALPQTEAFYGIFFPTWEQGAQAVRAIAQQRIPISMARLSDAQETQTTLKLSGKDQLVALAERGLGWLGYREGTSLLILGVTGDRRLARLALHEAQEISKTHGGLFTGQTIGNIWKKSRFLTPYLRNTLWEQGYAIDTLETAMPWRRVQAARPAIQTAIQNALAGFDERVLVFSHLSHIYRDGASIYTTYLFRRTADPSETLARWQAMKAAASLVILDFGGTISHQHGVGTDHAAYLPAEKGVLGMQLICSMAETLDPHGILNPGKLF